MTLAVASLMFLTLAHLIIQAIYLLLPLAALAMAIFGRKRWPGVRGAVTVAFTAGLGVSVAMNLVYAGMSHGSRHDVQVFHARPTAPQVLLGTYFAAAMFLLLRVADFSLQKLLRRLLGLHRDVVLRLRKTRIFAFALLRVSLLFGIGLPYVMATVMIYRPRVAPLDNPRTQLGFEYQSVRFKTSDGKTIAGWWIPAQDVSRRARRNAGFDADPNLSSQTVLVCHGLASSKSNQLILARQLVPAGFNCLVFDFRAHGESSGQITSFGANEKRDVLAAVRYLREQHPGQSQKIFGVGASMGGAALISAAADDSPEGRAIDAVATYACYDSLPRMVESVTDNYFAPPLNWLLVHIGLPIAELQTGVDLRGFSPARDSARLWPRPVLFIHGEKDEIIDFARGQSLLDLAHQPKYHLWFEKGTHNDILSDDTAARVVVEFFRTAKSLPVI